jgi:hypothetical protein
MEGMQSSAVLRGEAMPGINLTLRRGAFTKNVQHAVMAKLTDALMFWEKIPDTPEARKKMMGWVYEVAEDSDYNSGSPYHEDPFYFIEVRLLAGRFDRLTKQHLIRDFMKIIITGREAERIGLVERCVPAGAAF